MHASGCHPPASWPPPPSPRARSSCRSPRAASACCCKASAQAAAEAAPFVLLNVRVPASLLPDALAPHADAEGLVLLHVRMEKGVITDVGQEVPPTTHKLDMGGAVVLPCFVDAHTHLVKTHIATRLRNPTGSINDALCCEVDDHPNWKTPNDVARRMDFALRCAYHPRHARGAHPPRRHQLHRRRGARRVRLRGVRRGAVGVVGARPRALRSRQPLPPSLARRWRRRVCRPRRRSPVSCSAPTAATCRRRPPRIRGSPSMQSSVTQLGSAATSTFTSTRPTSPSAARSSRCAIRSATRALLDTRVTSSSATRRLSRCSRRRCARASRARSPAPRRRHRRVQPVHQHVPARSARHKRLWRAHRSPPTSHARRTAWAHREHRSCKLRASPSPPPPTMCATTGARAAPTTTASPSSEMRWRSDSSTRRRRRARGLRS